jgi:NAD(P)-dependent dehydrogenase (short-subunit alcohol dehydrogenase family)
MERMLFYERKKPAMSPSSQWKTIVITGCSSGFGRLTALYLAKLGWQVFATVRKEVDQASLIESAAALGCEKHLSSLICDITQPEQVIALGQLVAAKTSQLNALLNNAGTAFAAPLELISLDDLRAQLEINVVAHLGVTQTLLPLLKAARGTIINVSSLNGRIAYPLVGAYSASKFALEALSDVWRIELAPFGVQVVMIEPGSSPTNLLETSHKRAVAALEQYKGSPYEPLLIRFEKLASKANTTGFPPQLFPHTVHRILSSRRPHARYLIPRTNSIIMPFFQLVPVWLRDRLFRRILKW